MDSASRAAGATRPAKRARTMSASPAEAMLAHLEARGARFDPALRFRASGPGAGLGGFAARDIKKGEVVCALPLAMAVTSSAAERWWYGGGGADKPTTPAPAFVDGEFLLCMYLVAARRDLVSVPRVVRLYAASLSSVAPDTSSWDEVSRRRLRGSVAKATAVARNEVANWTSYCESIWAASSRRQPGQPPSFEEILWARGHCKSRRFPETLVKDGAAIAGAVSYSLLPGLDLLNHSNDPGVLEWVTDWDRQVLEFRALTDISEGSEVFNHYGPKSNTSLLFNPGFSLKDNPHDMYEARLMAAASESNSESHQGAEPVVLWEGVFTGFEQHLPMELLEQFAEEVEGTAEEGDGDGEAQSSEQSHALQLYVSADALEFLLSWLDALVQGYAQSDDCGDGHAVGELGSTRVNKDQDPRRAWVRHYEDGQRRILEHVQSLVRSLLQND